MLCCRSFEFRKICFRKVSGNPYKIFIIFCCFTCRRIVFCILRFQHLNLKTCIIDAGFFECFLTCTDFCLTAFNLCCQLIDAFFRKGKFCCRNCDRKCSQYCNCVHFIYRCQCDHFDFWILQCHLVFIFTKAVEVKIISIFFYAFHIFR